MAPRRHRAASHRRPPPASRRRRRPGELDAPGEAEQPFVRCFYCETDNSRHASSCSTCGRALDGEEQRRFNERFWAERRSRLAEEERFGAEWRAAAEQEQAETERLRRQAAEELAREVGRRERERLGRRGRGGLLSVIFDLLVRPIGRRWW